MITKLPQSEGNVLGFAVSGKLTEEDYAVMEADIDAAVAARGKIRLLAKFDAMESIEPSVIDDDIRIGIKHHENIDRMAIVSDKKVFDWMVSAMDYLMETEMRHFEPADEQVAWGWVRP